MPVASSHPRKKKRLDQRSNSTSHSDDAESAAVISISSSGGSGMKKTWDSTPWAERNEPSCEVSGRPRQYLEQQPLHLYRDAIFFVFLVNVTI